MLDNHVSRWDLGTGSVRDSGGHNRPRCASKSAVRTEQRGALAPATAWIPTCRPYQLQQTESAILLDAGLKCMVSTFQIQLTDFPVYSVDMQKVSTTSWATGIKACLHRCPFRLNKQQESHEVCVRRCFIGGCRESL